MKNFKIAITILLLSKISFGQDFIITYYTGNYEMLLPCTGNNYTVKWVDLFDTSSHGIYTATNTLNAYMPRISTYKVSISGGSPAFSRINFNGSSSAMNVRSIEQWGNIQWSSMAGAFYGCRNMVVNATDIPDLNNVTDMSNMFMECFKFNTDISNWNTSNVTNMSGTFCHAVIFNQPLNSWNTSNVTDMSLMFQSATVFNQPIGNWDTHNVKDMVQMFYHARNFNQQIGSWNTGNVKNMKQMFFFAQSFNQPIDSWNTSNVTNMVGMFNSTNSFNQPINSWNTSSVITMEDMFSTSYAFNQPINNWNTANVKNMRQLFYYAYAFNQPIGTWNTSNVTDMSGMFGSTVSFNQPIGTWNTSNVINMNEMFNGAKSFNQPIGTWNTSNVTDMSSMFSGTLSFNQPIGTWNTVNVSTMKSMFAYASSFNQSLGMLNITNVTDMRGMLNFSGLSVASYDSTLAGWSIQAVRNGLLLNALNLRYCTAQSQRNDLITMHNWTITNDNFYCGQSITPIALCSNDSTSFTCSFSGSNYHWQVNDGSGFVSILLPDTSNHYSGQSTRTLHIRNIPSSWYGYQYRCVADGSNSNIYQIQIKNTWIGEQGNAWENPLNWSCKRTPDSYSDVIINTGTVILNSNTTIRSLTISPNATLTVEAPATLTIIH